MTRRPFPKFEEWFAFMKGATPEPTVDTKKTQEYKDAVKSEKNSYSDNLKKAMKIAKGSSNLRQLGIIAGYHNDYIQARQGAGIVKKDDNNVMRNNDMKKKTFIDGTNEHLEERKKQFPKLVNGKNVLEIANNVYLPNDEINARNKIRKKAERMKLKKEKQ